MNKGYYRPLNMVHEEWYRKWENEIKLEVPPEEILDMLCHLACGIGESASDQCQAYAKHIHTHLIAAFRVGKKVGEKAGKTILPESEQYISILLNLRDNATIVNKLAVLYISDPTGVANVCDLVLDRSGELLGKVREERKKIVNATFGMNNIDAKK